VRSGKDQRFAWIDCTLALPVAITFLKFSFHVRSQLPTEPEKIEFKEGLQEASSARNSPDLITPELSEVTSNERPSSIFHVIELILDVSV